MLIAESPREEFRLHEYIESTFNQPTSSMCDSRWSPRARSSMRQDSAKQITHNKYEHNEPYLF